MPFWQSELFKEKIIYQERFTYEYEIENPSPKVSSKLNPGIHRIIDPKVEFYSVEDNAIENYTGEPKPYTSIGDNPLVDATVSRGFVGIRVRESGVIIESP